MMENSEAGDSTDNSLSTSLGLSLPTPTSPPDQASICMDKNRESLKRKLMLRRSVTELVDQGIYPSLKTPPAFADKTRQLERAKTGDLLRHKIQQRPNRQLLVQQHILEDTNIDPSLHERQRLLKRSRLLDDLNDKLSHRPGPLELVQENILQPSLELVNAIRDGSVQFMSTSDTEDMDQSGPSLTFDDSSGSGGIQCPSFDESSALYVVSSPSPVLHGDCLPVSFTSTDNIPVPVPATVCPQIPFVVSTVSSPGSTAEVLSSHPGTSNIAFLSLDNNNNSSSNNNNSGSKSRSKKPKPKVVPKSRIIKFHEYKGPPSAIKNQSSTTPAPISSSSEEDTPYNILLQQQQLFLQLQLQFQQMQQQQSSSLVPGAQTEQNLASSGMKSVVVTSPPVTQPILAGNAALVQTISFHEPQVFDTNLAPQPIISKIAVSPVTTAQTSGQILNAQTVSTSQASLLSPQTRPTQSTPRQSAKALTSIPTSALSLPKLTGNLEEMKVADLKAELKKRSLPVSGSKPQLIERLKPFTDSSSSMPSSPVSIIPKSDSRPSSCLSTPLQFSQAPVVSAPSSSYTPVVSITQSNTSAPASLVNPSPQNNSSRSTPSFSLLPRATKQGRTIVSVKPFIKDELAITEAISVPSSPQTLITTSSGTIKTNISPVHKVSSAPALLKPAVTSSKNLRLADANQKTFPYGDQNSVSETSNSQALASVTTETSQPTSVTPAGMMQMEVDPDLLPLFHQYVSSVPTDNHSTSMDTGLDDSVVIKESNVNPNTSPATSRIIHLGSSADPAVKISSQNTEPLGFKTTVGDVTAHSATAGVPVPQQASTHMSQVQLAAPSDHTVTSSASVLQLQQLQQLQILQHLQQQLMQQTQAQQQQFQHQIFQEQSPSSSVQLTESDHMVLAQAKQIQELQRQLQESHHRLELNQQHHEQQQMQVPMPSDFPQQQQQPSPVMQHQHEPVSVGYSDPSAQSPPTVLSGASTSVSQRSDNQALVFTALPTIDAPPDYNSGIVSRTTSVPPSPLATNQQKLNIHRCSSAPYISGQLKDPPYYHEAIRQKQQQMNSQGNMKNSATSLHSPTSCLNLEQVASDCKSQAMDDVLEILIRHGELPPNAATEAFPSSEQTRARTMPQTSAATTFISSPSSLPRSSSKSPVSVTTSNDQMNSYPSSGSSVTSTTRSMTSQQHNQPNTSRTDSSDPILSLEHPDSFNKALLNDTQFSSSKIHDDAAPSSPLMNEDTSGSVFGEFLDWGDMIPSADLSAMDFSVEFGFDQLYLGDSEHSLDANICQDNQFSQEQIKSRLDDTSSSVNTTHLNNPPHSHSDSSGTPNMFMHGSEPHSSLDQHGHCNETLTASNQMDTSEWLDAFMPDSSIHHMNTDSVNKPTSASFTTNSYMMPHSQQEWSDNYSDSGILQSSMGWEQLANQGAGS